MNRFSIGFNWLPRDYGDAIARATFAEIKITIDGWPATEVEDFFAKTVRPGVRASAYVLAQWFAFNWWRLRWEPQRNTSSWKMSHKVGAAGEGYLWPDLTFISDGGTVLIHTKSSPPVSEQPVRYLNNFDVFIPADEFEHGIDIFIEAVIDRLTSAGIGAAELVTLWNEVLEERRDPNLVPWRKLEAIMGFDPGEAPDQLMADLQSAAHEYGASAIEEMAAASMENALSDINTLWDGPRRYASSLRVPNLDTLHMRIREEIKPSALPWQKAAEAARMAREVWSLDAGPVSTSTLSGVFAIDQRTLEEPSVVDGPMNAGFRNGSIDAISVFLKSPYSLNRRFALLRLVGDHLIAPQEDRLLPSAQHVSTQRQKFQRAFAQEFLCPYSALIRYLGQEEPGDEAIENAAHHFNVSALMVKTVLVNKGHLERSFLPT